MLRPATPLSVLLLAAFGLLLISVLSTPIIQAIPLGSFNNYNFGVFGYCNGNTCSAIEIGYDTCMLRASHSFLSDIRVILAGDETPYVAERRVLT